MDTTFTAAILTAIVTVLVALAGYLITYWNNVRLSQRAEQLERINKQLAEFYGPLYSLVSTGTQTWEAFRTKYRPGKSYFESYPPPTEEELKAWRLWMATVFMPQNIQMQELIESKTDLLIETDMPECLEELCAHVAAYRVVLKQWEHDDFTEHASIINFTGKKLLDYSHKSFKSLKEKQAKLIGEIAKR